MTAPMIRGYCVLKAVAFMESHYSRDKSTRLKEQLSANLRAVLPGIKPGDWVPRSHYVEIVKAIASLRGPEIEVFRDLVGCGQFVAAEADNVFMRILHTVLTPPLFAKKASKLWDLDHRGSGYVEVDSADALGRRIRMRLVDVAGYDHIGVTHIGRIKHAFSELGEPNVQVQQKGWSQDLPGPSEIAYEVTW